LGYELSQITQQVIAQFRKRVNFLLRVDSVLLEQRLRFVFGRRERVQVSGEASNTREEIDDLSLYLNVKQT